MIEFVADLILQSRALVILFFVLTFVSEQARSFFPADYEDSRRVFRRVCADRWVQGGYPKICRIHPVPSATDPDLTVDSAYHVRGGEKLLVLLSGVHGPEAHAGAAVAELFRQTYLETYQQYGVDVLVVHALNPYGFKTLRRVDERNVNLNRNFRLSWDQPKPNLAYERWRDLFEPVGKVTSVTGAYLGSDLRLLFALGERFVGLLPGSKQFKRAFTAAEREISEGMNRGQFDHPEGLNFGGTGPAAQVEILRGLLEPLIATHRETLVLDWHTGLGAEGTLHLMIGEGSAPPLAGDLKKAWAPFESRGLRTTAVAEDSGFFRTDGDVIDFATALASPGHAVTAVTAEFGTLGGSIPAQLRSAHRIITENQSWFRGCANERVCQKVRRDFRALFNPPSEAWRSRALDLAALVFESIAPLLGVDSKRLNPRHP